MENLHGCAMHEDDVSDWAIVLSYVASVGYKDAWVNLSFCWHDAYILVKKTVSVSVMMLYIARSAIMWGIAW